MTPALTVEVLASLRADHAATVEGLQRRCRDLGDQLDAALRRCAKLEGDLAAMRDLVDERAEMICDAAIDWFRDYTGAALAADNVRLRGEVARLRADLAARDAADAA